MCPFNESMRTRRHDLSDDFEVVSSPRKGAQPYDPSLSWEDYATKYLEFTDTAPTVYHAIDYISKGLKDAGFKYLSERESWEERLQPGGKYFTTRNGTAYCAFVIGKSWKPSNGAGIVGTHTDSLASILKPSSKKDQVDGYELLGVAPYASGGVGPTWWDRDLGIGGRLVVRDGNGVRTKLVRSPHPIARIPTLAPHFGAVANGPFNPETQQVPIVGLVDENEKLVPTAEESKSPLIDKHSLRLLRAISNYSGVAVKDILEFDLQLFDTQPAALGGLDKEFIFSPRIDDKICTFTAYEGIIEAADEIAKGSTLGIVAGYDNEEIGSLSRQGARGNLLESVIDRVLGDIAESIKKVFYANSFFVSADVNHAVNPNFSNVYLEHHKPKLNVGVTLSRDPNGNMITDGLSASFIYELGRRTGNQIQQFQIRNDSRSGGTIGPGLSAKTGLRGVDLGIPQLSMHSIRATTGSKDVWLGVRFFKSFYEAWSEVDAEFKLGDL
ncbi:Vacuolar aminopeptidase 1 [Wickerhamiella sorbophila]|uniref:Vacuolar aminopeptidase 1 n=1 Tax=Wickerhamiella sorbophila TaxID=45607 RepID=A0A2T0FL49_9ASCO|nr:Vacuolar aminopeptidase 1 [Wickerhamiella sorbophila]PRT55709.1 Vacuolar aminopeptidase 1 [Wickerhamiella sorbophila]